MVNHPRLLGSQWSISAALQPVDPANPVARLIPNPVARPACTKAFITILLFDRNFNFVDLAFEQIDAGATATHDLLEAQIAVEEPGYAYTYISNENPNLIDVYFDDMTVTHTKSPVIQYNEYYPFGLTFNSYQRENSTPNKWKFQGQEHIDDLDLGWDSFKWRNHQPEIGRFFNVDPLAEKYVYNSPYAFSENKVTSFIELEGLEAVRPMRPQYQSMQNYRSMVRREMIRTSYEYSTRELEVVQREPISMRPSQAGEATGLMLEFADSWGLEGKLRSLQISVTKQDVMNTNGFGDTSIEKSEFVFSGPDAGKLEAMENDYQSKSNAAFDKKFEAFASEKLGKDFSSLSSEEQAQFRVDNLKEAGAIRMGVNSELGPSPKQQVLKQVQDMLKQGTVTETVKRKDLPVIRQGN